MNLHTDDQSDRPEDQRPVVMMGPIVLRFDAFGVTANEAMVDACRHAANVLGDRPFKITSIEGDRFTPKLWRFAVVIVEQAP